MGWDYSAILVYGVLVDSATIPAGEESAVEYIDNLCFKNAVWLTVFYVYGGSPHMVVYDTGQCRVEGYEANAISPVEAKPLSNNLLSVLKILEVEPEPKLYLGVSVS